MTATLTLTQPSRLSSIAAIVTVIVTTLVSMNALVIGDDTGLVKLVRVKDKAVVTQYGAQSLGRGVQHLALAHDNDTAHLLSSHADSTLSLFDLHSANLVATQSQSSSLVGLFALTPINVDTGTQWKNTALAAGGPVIVSCDGKGELRAQSLASIASPESSAPFTPASWSLGGPITRARSSTFIPGQLVAGGKENIVQLFDIGSESEMWRGKNVKHDHLNLRQPIEPADFAFVDATRLIEGTFTRMLRLYDTKAQRLPMFSIKTGDDVITSVAVYDNTAFVATGAGALQRYDLRTRLMIGGYKGGTQGSVRGIDINDNDSQVASVSLDRFARVFDIRSRALVTKIYLKQKLNCCQFVRDDSMAAVKEEQEGEDAVKAENVSGDDHDEDVTEDEVDEEEVWEELERRRVTATQDRTNGTSRHQSTEGEDDDETAIKLEALSGDDDDDDDDADEDVQEIAEPAPHRPSFMLPQASKRKAPRVTDTAEPSHMSKRTRSSRSKH